MNNKTTFLVAKNDFISGVSRRESIIHHNLVMKLIKRLFLAIGL